MAAYAVLYASAAATRDFRFSEQRLQDGIDRGYFSEKDIADARSKGDYALRLITALRSSLDR